MSHMHGRDMHGRPLSPLQMNQLNRASPAGMMMQGGKRVSPLPGVAFMRSMPVSGIYLSKGSTSSYGDRPTLPLNGHAHMPPTGSRPSSRMKQPSLTATY